MTDEKPQGSQPADETQPVRPEGAPVEQPAAAQPTTQPTTPTADPTADPTTDQDADQTSAIPPAPAYAASTVAPAAPVAKRGFRDRLRRMRSSDGNRAFSLGALIASGLAGLIVGGLGVTAVHAVGHDGPDRGNWSEQRGPMGGTFGGPGGSDQDGGRGPSFGQGGMPGQVQPTTPPDEDGDSGSTS